MIYLNEQLIEVTIFPDKTSQVWKIDENIIQCIRRENYAKIRWDFSEEAELMHLYQLVVLLRKETDADLYICLDLSYLPFGRQDKDISNHTTFALYAFARLLNYLALGRVIILDPHNHALTLRLINKAYIVYPLKIVKNIMQLLDIDYIFYPDKNAFEKYRLRYDAECFSGRKERCNITGNITSYEIHTDKDIVNKNILIVDDICDGGSTFVHAAKKLATLDVKNIHLFTTHGIFSKGLTPLQEAGIKRIFTHKGEVIQSDGVVTMYKEIK